MAERRVVWIERSGERLCVRPGRRFGVWIWFNAAEAPEVEGSGQEGYFEIERVRGAGRRAPKWRIIGPAADPYGRPAP